jgi:hypothetical protein
MLTTISWKRAVCLAGGSRSRLTIFKAQRLRFYSGARQTREQRPAVSGAALIDRAPTRHCQCTTLLLPCVISRAARWSRP